MNTNPRRITPNDPNLVPDLCRGLLALPALAQDNVIHVYNWSDYIAEDTVAKFEEATGIKVVYDVYDSNEVLEAKLLTGNSGYDVVVPTSSFLQRQIGAGVYQPLDKAKLPNLANMDPALMERAAAYDPGNEHAVDLHVGHHRHRLRRGEGEGAAGRGCAARQLGAGVRSAVCREAGRLRHHPARLVDRHVSGGAGVSRARSAQHRGRRHGEGGGAAGRGAAAYPLLPARRSTSRISPTARSASRSASPAISSSPPRGPRRPAAASRSSMSCRRRERSSGST